MVIGELQTLRGICSFLLPLFLVKSPCVGGFTQRHMADLDEFVHDVMSCRNIPGLTLSLVKDGQTVYAKGYGVSDVRRKSPVTNTTKFCIGSLSKGFTASLLAAVIGRNQSLSWDTIIKDILGEDFYLSDEHRTRFATIRDILAHKTGIPGYFGALMTGYQTSVRQIIRGLRFMPASETFHTKYTYNNFMFILAGHVVEKLTGKSLEALARETLFEPLSMNSATFIHKITSWGDFALPHMSFNGELRPLDTIWLQKSSVISAAGGICLNAVDMAKWMQFHLRGGTHSDGQPIIDRDTFQEMHTPQIPTPMPLGKKLLKPPMFPISAGRFAYNLGWGSGTYRGYHTLLHGGRVYGYDSNLWLFPDKNIGIFTSVNGPMNDDSMNGLRVLHYKLSDLLLGEPPWLNHSTACSFPDPWLKNSESRKMTITTDSEGQTNEVKQDFSNQKRIRRMTYFPTRQLHRPLKEYVGEYGHYAFGVIRVVMNHTDHFLHLRHGMFGHALLFPGSYKHTFNMKFLDILEYITEADGWDHLLPIVFGEGSDGRIKHVNALFIEPKAPPVFKRGLNWRDIPEAEYAYSSRPCFPMVTSNSIVYIQVEICKDAIPTIIIGLLIVYSIL